MNVLIVRYEDWEEMFLEGTSVTEGHSVCVIEALRACGIEVTTREATRAEEDEKCGYKPKD